MVGKRVSEQNRAQAPWGEMSDCSARRPKQDQPADCGGALGLVAKRRAAGACASCRKATEASRRRSAGASPSIFSHCGNSLCTRPREATPPPDAPEWSRTSMAKAMKLRPSTVGRIWHQYGLKPHLVRTSKVSERPMLCLEAPRHHRPLSPRPKHAIVLCCDFEEPRPRTRSHAARLAAQERSRPHHDP